MTTNTISDKKPRTRATAGLFLGLLGILCGYAVTLLFPRVELASYDWHVRATAHVSIDPSIVLVTFDEQDPASCGNGRWNTSTLASAISAMQKAGASVIAPAIPLQAPNPPECGDVLGTAQLLEATKQSGNVVYPSFVQTLLANEARATGWFTLTPDDDEIFRGLSSKQMSHGQHHLPFGLAIASAYTNGDSLQLPEQGLITFAGQWADQPFPTYMFSKLFELVQKGENTKLASLVQDKIVVLFPVTEHSTMLGTPLETSAPMGFLHANLLNTALTHSWLQKPSWGSWLFQTCVLVLILAFLSSRRWVIGRWFVVGVIILLHFGMNLLSFSATGTVWPYLTSSFAILGTLLGTQGWPMYAKRKKTREQIHEVLAQRTALQEKLARKELAVERLEEDLQAAKVQAQETSQQYTALSTTEDETRSRLQEAEGEAEDARQQLEILQQELSQLRQVTPVPIKTRSEPSDPDLQALQRQAEMHGIVTQSPILLKTFHELKKAAVAQSPILILGETGTGKELFARAVHRLSKRSLGPFVSVNMAAIRPELFESELFGHVKGAFTGAISRRGFLETADRGSMFLDEIGELPLDLQAKLLRVLESGEFYRVGQSSPTQIDVRIIAATNRDLRQAMNVGQYREDLYYRLRSFVITLPPLRERGKEDINLLVERIIDDLSEIKEENPVHVTQGALEAILTYDWPGNVRELRQTLAQAVALAEGGSVTTEDLRLPGHKGDEVVFASTLTEVASKSICGKETLAQREDEFVLSMLRKHGFDMQATAKALEWDRSTVTQKLKGLGFQALVEQESDVHKAAVVLAGNPALEKVVELKLGEYYRNLLASTSRYQSAEQALSDCRKRMRNIAERHFPAIETLIHQHFENSHR